MTLDYVLRRRPPGDPPLRLLAAVCLALSALPASAQGPGAVVGVVYDSVARSPLAGAVVQLVAADSAARGARSVASDARGRFELRDVPRGWYTIGFLHPMLDSLGLEPTLHAVYVAGGEATRNDLAIPPPARIRAALCRAPILDSTAVVVGIVRDAGDGAPIRGASVAAEWIEYALQGGGGVSGRLTRIIATTAPNGWFALCDVPRSGAIGLIAHRGADSTDLVEVQLSSTGFLRRELYLGQVGTAGGSLTGSVVAAANGRPLAGARVALHGGPETRADENGEWTLAGASPGTRMLEIRAVGYYPERRIVDVVRGARQVRSSLWTMEAVLDTVRVTAMTLRDVNMRGFAERRRRGIGHFMTPEDVARRHPVETSDLFRVVPGMFIEHAAPGEYHFTMRGLFEDRCTPAIYVDGHLMVDGNLMTLDPDEIDVLVHPNEIAGMEVYPVGAAPPQFQPTLAGCGSVVIWTRLRPNSSDGSSWKARTAKISAAVIVGAIIGLTLSPR